MKVLVVDDARLVREQLAQLLGADPALAVSAVGDGYAALKAIKAAPPDAVVLDIEMPGIDGLETLALIRALYPKLPVIMFSTLTRRGAAATLDALALGASDYVTKPGGVGAARVAPEDAAATLGAKLKALGGVGRSVVGKAPHGAHPLRSAVGSAPVKVVAVGSSTGGPNALAEVFRALPADLPVPVVVVQHMPPIFTRLLAERLASVSRLPVREAVDGAPLVAGEAWVAPGDVHLEIGGTDAAPRLRLTHAPPENSCRPAVDVLFRSAAAVHGAGVLAVVLTGMGKDGCAGAQRICAAGGAVLAQDEATSVVWGMPMYVAQAGLASAVLPLAEIAPAILARLGAAAAARKEQGA